MGPIQVAFLVGAALVVLAPPPVSGCGRGAMIIQNNGYRQVLIAIGEEVPENPNLIESIKKAFTALSQRLYQATRKRAYLAQINILVPKSWKQRPEHKVPGNEAIGRSDIVVDKPDPRQGDKPFVLRSTPCGELGQYMHLTPNYLLNTSVSKPLGPVDKLLVHEWAHLRYGVFDEYATESEPHFYSGQNGKVEATRCSYALSGYQDDKVTHGPCNTKGNLPDDNCRFSDLYGDGFVKEYGSLMYRQYLDHIVEFCDNAKKRSKVLHNPDAPNQQNRKCGKRSVWEVLRSHDDFKNNNPPCQIDDTTPTFTILKAQENRYILVLDISGSMSGSKIKSLGRGCSNFIRNIVQDGEMVGVVHFSSPDVTKTAAELTKISSKTRIQLLAAIPISANGGTSIGSGLREGIEVLKGNGGTAKGGNLILVSDGQETTDLEPTLMKVRDEVIREKIIVYTIAFTDAADSQMDEVAIATGGLSFLYSDDANSNALNEGFKYIVEQNQNVRDKKIPISSTAEMVAPGAPISKKVSIDSTLGMDIEFHFDYNGSDINVELTSPSGDMYKETSPIVYHDIKFGLYSFKFTGMGKTGEWTYKISNTDIVAQKVAVTLVSKTVKPGTYPIMAQAFWGHRELDAAGEQMEQTVYASVSQGYKAVLNTDVVAVIERPIGGSINLPLKDNGAGADQTKDDGIYSEYFVDRFVDGRYNLKVLVNSTYATTISSIHVVGQGAASPHPDNNTYPDVKVTGLQRVASGGSFQVKNSALLPDGKVYKPGQVTDLQVTSVNLQDSTVNLTWTAQGAELTSGTVSSYEIRYATDFESINENFTQQALVSPSMLILGNLTGPSSPGQTELFTVRMPSRGNITYTFSLVSNDMDGRQAQSEPSNTASAGMKAFRGNPQGKPSGSNNNSIIVGCIFGGVTCIVIITLISIFGFKFSKRNQSPNGIISLRMADARNPRENRLVNKGFFNMA